MVDRQRYDLEVDRIMRDVLVAERNVDDATAEGVWTPRQAANLKQALAGYRHGAIRMLRHIYGVDESEPG